MTLEEIARFAGEVDKTVEFYQRLLGVSPEAWARGQTAVFRIGDVKLFFHQKLEWHEPGWPLKDEDHISFVVDSVDQACADLEQRGLRPVVGPQDFYWGRSAYFRDPDGQLIELHQGGTGDGS